jgi:ABC-type transporter Mla MlaB component
MEDIAEDPGAGGRFRVSAQSTGGRVVLRLEGRLTAPDLGLVENALREAVQRSAWVVLELSGLRSLDDGAAAALAELARTGVELVGASGFVSALVRAASPSGR